MYSRRFVRAIALITILAALAGCGGSSTSSSSSATSTMRIVSPATGTTVKGPKVKTVVAANAAHLVVERPAPVSVEVTVA